MAPGSYTRSARRVSRSAANRSTASLESSDGWIRTGPHPSHRVDPLTLSPSPGTRTSTSSTRDATTAGRDRRRQRW
jgi:hypothetical protein